MSSTFIMLGFYFCMVKSMDWKLHFYTAAPIFVAIVTVLQFALDSAFAGHRQPISIWLVVLRLTIFLAVFCALEYMKDDSYVLWWVVWIVGAAALVLAH